MKLGTKVKIKTTAQGSDRRHAGRKGIVIEFDSSLEWSCPRAMLAPEQFICVHFYPKSKREKKDGSPIALMDQDSLVEIK